MARLSFFLMLALLLQLGCDSPRLRQDLDDLDAQWLADGSSADSAGLDGRVGADPDVGLRDDGSAVDGAVSFDLGVLDLGALDVGRTDFGESHDAGLTFDLGAADLGAVDQGAADQGQAGIDSGGPVDSGETVDSGAFDLGPVDGALLEVFVEGEARAMAGELVTVSGGGVQAEVDAAGHFVLGPLPDAPVELVFSAPGHETLRQQVDLSDGDVALDDEVVLFRGRRLTRQVGERLLFRFDDSWLLWEAGETLVGTPTADGAVRDLVAQDYEVFLGFAPQSRSVVVRKRTRPGIAGDIWFVPLEGDDPVRVFVEAQPWVRWVGEQMLAMVQTREALSVLQRNAPGAEAEAVGVSVPWLLVTTLSDGQLAWLEGPGPQFEVMVGGLDGRPKRRISIADGPASDRFMIGTPGRSGVLWRTPAGALWRWEPGELATQVAEDVLENPRPRFIAGGRLLFWRAEDDGTERGFLTDGVRETEVVTHANGNTLREVGGGQFYVERPNRGLWYGSYEGDGADVLQLLDGERVRFTTASGGVVALVNGAAFGHHAETGVIEYGLAEVSSLRNAGPGGVTVWEPARETLWYLPAPTGVGAQVPLAVGAQSPAVVMERGGAAIYALGAQGWVRRAMPPEEDEPGVLLEVETAGLTSLGATLLLGQTVEGALYAFDPPTGQARQWADGVRSIRPSSRGGFIAYTCARGTYLVDLR